MATYGNLGGGGAQTYGELFGDQPATYGEAIVTDVPRTFTVGRIRARWNVLVGLIGGLFR